MKNQFKNVALLFSFIAIITLTLSCEEEADEQKPYVGTWESIVYPVPQFDSTGAITDTTWEQMVFTFTNTTFEDEIYQGLSADAVVAALTIGGDIENPSEGLMKATINKIVVGGAAIDLETQELLFNATFDGALGDRIEKSFDANYVIDGDNLTFTLPMLTPAGKVDTPLKLTKKK